MVDCYLSWDIEFTTRLAEYVRELDIKWFEDPLENGSAEHLNVELRSKISPIQVAIGNLEYDYKAFAAILAHRACDVIQPELQCSDVFLQTGLEPRIAAANDPSLLVRSRDHKMFQLAVELCANFGCSHLTGLPGVPHEGTSAADDLALAHAEAAWRQSMAAGAGIKYAIEPHIGPLCPDVAATQMFVDSVPGLTLTLDYGHFVAAGIPCEEIHSLLPYASHVHVRAGAPGRLQTTLDENTVDFAQSRIWAHREHRLGCRQGRQSEYDCLFGLESCSHWPHEIHGERGGQ